MYPQMVYHADVRAREKELAATEMEMGCCSCAPLGRMISRCIMKRNGKLQLIILDFKLVHPIFIGRLLAVGRERRMRYDERTGMDYAMAYAPPQTCYVRPTAARTVTLATTTTNAHADHPDAHPPRAHAATTLPLAPAGGAPAQRAGLPPRKPKKKKKKHVRFTPSGPPVPARGDDAAAHDTATVASGGGAYHHGPPADPSSYSPAPAHGYGHAYGYGQYAPSPLPRWEMLGTPRRHEYFSSEYRWYYPTPVREGIYSFATDANGRLTTIFSEENPNACTIV